MGQVNIGGGAVVGEEVEGIAVLTPSANVSVDLVKGNIFTLTPGQDETLTATNVTNGENVKLVVTASGATSRTLTFGTGFKTSGTLATGTSDAKVFVINFISVGGVLLETGRTAAM